MRTGMRVAVVLALSLAASVAVAQGTPPDVVRLTDGGMVRGTIIQLVPDDFVEIQLPTSETRRYPMAEVAWAGPAAEMPVADAQRPADSEQQGLRLQLEAREPDTTFHVHAGDTVASSGLFHAVGRSYERLCTAPCETRLPAGSYRLALSSEGGSPIRADEPVRLEDDSVLVGEYQSRGGVRALGWILMAVGAIGGSVIGIVPLMNQPAGEPKDYTWFYIGVGVGAAVMVVGMLMTFTQDGAEIEARPLSP